jgi:hypothetical protein
MLPIEKNQIFKQICLTKKLIIWLKLNESFLIKFSECPRSKVSEININFQCFQSYFYLFKTSKFIFLWKWFMNKIEYYRIQNFGYLILKSWNEIFIIIEENIKILCQIR